MTASLLKSKTSEVHHVTAAPDPTQQKPTGHFALSFTGSLGLRARHTQESTATEYNTEKEQKQPPTGERVKSHKTYGECDAVLFFTATTPNLLPAVKA